MVDAAALDQAAEALRAGEIVVYPTETVYGLGADALTPPAIEQVFEAKHRDRDKPISMAVPSVDAVSKFADPSDREVSFCREFLPGPVTVVLPARKCVPPELLGGRDRVGVRVPDHDIALSLLDRFAPVTATSANVSGRASANRVGDLDPEIRTAAAVILDGGETQGGGSTVVNVEDGTIIREGALADRIKVWLEE
ncbi:MAG: L-threonylcarbamoyladenylate synthase [Salinirussus sp.]